jgi:N-acetylglucosaminyldiphosphoundecaprenol N-acetyl-beta-D-mannosaminyltransferase
MDAVRPPGAPPVVRVLGLPVHAASLPDVLAAVDRFVSERRPRQLVTANALMLLAARADAGVRRAFEDASLVLPESAGARLAGRVLGRPFPPAPAGVELVDLLCGRASEKGWRVYFLGAASGVAEAAAGRLRARHPGLVVAGCRDGFFTDAEEAGVAAAVAAARPDLLFVGMSAARQEPWIHRNLDRLGAAVALGVGGSFDVLSGRLARAPRWMRAAGLEWLFRWAQEPWRAPRMARLPVFLSLVLAQRLREGPAPAD